MRAQEPPLASEGGNVSWVCLGDEWHRFPSHFLLPSAAYRLAFVGSGFRGLLPRPFDQQQVWSLGGWHRNTQALYVKSAFDQQQARLVASAW